MKQQELKIQSQRGHVFFFPEIMRQDSAWSLSCPARVGDSQSPVRLKQSSSLQLFKRHVQPI